MGGSKDQTTTSESSPWVGQQPYLQDIFRQAQGQYNQGPQQYYPGSTVAPFSPQSQQAMDMMTNRAMSGSPQQDAFGNYLSGQMNQQNVDPNAIMNPAQQAAGGIGAGQQMMQQAPQAAAGGVNSGQQMLQQAGQPNSMVTGAGSTLGQTAGGDFLGSNPYLDQMFDTASGRAGEAFSEQTMPAIAAQFGSSGRTGSGIHQQMAGNAQRQFGRDLQGMAADIYAPAYEAERDRMNQAAAQQGQLGLGMGGLQAQAGQGMGQLGLGMGGLQAQAGQGMGQLGLGGVGAMGEMYGNIANNQFRAGSLAPSYQQMQYNDIDRLMGVGGMVEDQSQRLMDANQNRFNYGQQAPWNNLQNYSSAIYGLPGGYGTQSSTQPGGSRMQGAMGGAMMGSQIPGAGGWGALGGAVLGGLL